jgi:stage III sporulation protein AH
MTIITNRYTFGLIIAALFAAMIYIGYLEFRPAEEMVMLEDLSLGEETQTVDYQNIVLSTMSNTENGPKFFIEYRLERDRTRSRQLELLQNIVEDPNSVAETRQEAQQKILQISNYLEQELQLENLIKAKGFEDAVAFIQPHSVTIVINQTNFEDSEITTIADLATNITSQSLENIFIIPKGEV